MFLELITTIINRPYVFIFLIAYLIIAHRLWGIKTTIVWMITCYIVAWSSEYSSIHTGFPYGWYEYVYENLKGELLIKGVPFFDSLSYSFLIFAGWMMAMSNVGNNHCTDPLNSGRHRGLPLQQIKYIIWGALFTMLLDVIIDPVATMGSMWFLGEIHRYLHPGFYFGVPLTNFGGWFLTAFVAIFVNILLWQIFPSIAPKQKHSETKIDNRLPILFYCGIALFNIAIALWLRQFLLAGISTLILIIPLFSVLPSFSPQRST